MSEIMLSLFQGYSDTCPTEISLNALVEMIRKEPFLADHTAKHRYCLQQGWKTDAARAKAHCACFAVAVRFADGKKRENICGWTHLCLADFDHIPEERMEDCLQQIRQDPHTLLAYTTISGKGIRVICPYVGQAGAQFKNETELYKLAFEQVNQHYAQLTGLAFDGQCKNITRLSGLAHDPEAWFVPDAQPFEIMAQPSSTAVPKTARSQTRLRRVVAAIRQELAQAGIEYAEHHRNEYIMRTGYLLNAYGVALQAATEWGLEIFADYDGDVSGIFRSCYAKTEEHGTRMLPARSAQKSPAGREAVSDIETFLAAQGRYRKNTVTGKCEMCPDGDASFEDVTDRTVNTLWCRMCKEVRPVRIQDMRAVLESEFVPLHNPFASYFDNLPAWDGQTDHIARLAAQVHVKTGKELFPAFFKKWLVAMVASLFDNDVVNHEILVLIGRQGIYKTTWLNNLLPPELRRYFYLKSNSRNISRDDMLTLAEFAIVCLEELDEMEGREMNQLKALTTMRHVNERAAYAHFKMLRPHIASFCGTSNNLHFLTDQTGNRRWMPFEVENIDSPYDHPLDYAGIYAQAFHLATSDFPYWLEEEELRQLNEHNRHFEVPSLERELIQTYFQRPLPGQECSFLTNAQILLRISVGIRHKLSAVKIGIAMKQEGYEAIRQGGKRGYRVVELTGEAIELRKKAMARYGDARQEDGNRKVDVYAAQEAL